MKRSLFPFIVTVLLLSGTRLVAVLADRRVPEKLAVPLERIDREIAGWTAIKDNRLEPGVLKELEPTSYLSRIYRKGDAQADLFISYYAQQRAGESMHSPKHCLPGSGWEIWKHGSAAIPLNGETVRVNRYSIQNSGQRMLMFYWYQSRNRIIASEYVGKILLARDTLLSGRTAASIVRITLPDTPGKIDEGIAFSAELIPQVHRSFGN